MEIKALTFDGVDGVHKRHLQQMLQCQMLAIATCVLMTNWTERGEAINAMTAYDILWQIMMTFMWTLGLKGPWKTLHTARTSLLKLSLREGDDEFPALERVSQ